jgi:hypothetical protein
MSGGARNGKQMIGRLWRNFAITLSLALFLGLALPSVEARERQAATAAELSAELAAAGPGDVVTIAPGVYEVPRIALRQSGSRSRPITVRANRPGTVEIRTQAEELFKIEGSDWVFENLDIAGLCAEDAQCEHAFHIVGGADRTVIRHNRVRDFNAQIKGNGEGGRFPRDVVIEGNTLFDTHMRAVELPLVAVDVVGGEHWIVRGNLIADFGKTVDHPPRRPDDFGYAVFLKGNSSQGVIEGNIVVCGLTLPPAPDTRGLSLGGSASDPDLCMGTCATEHRDGVIRDNLVIDCPTGLGIYLYKASNTRVAGNVLVDTRGVAARSPQTVALVAENVVSGGLAAIDGARIMAENNLVTDLAGTPAVIAEAGDTQADVRPQPGARTSLALGLIGDDLCGYLRKLPRPGGRGAWRTQASCAGAAADIADYRRYVAKLRQEAAAAGRDGAPKAAGEGKPK